MNGMFDGDDFRGDEFYLTARIDAHGAHGAHGLPALGADTLRLRKFIIDAFGRKGGEIRLALALLLLAPVRYFFRFGLGRLCGRIFAEHAELPRVRIALFARRSEPVALCGQESAFVPLQKSSELGDLRDLSPHGFIFRSFDCHGPRSVSHDVIIPQND
jgi:hypothetical protein